MDKSYSPFPALVTVLAILVLYFSFDLYVTLRQRSVQHSQMDAVAKVLPEAQKINTSMMGLSRDLVALAPHSPGAKKLVDDFKIQAVRQAPPAKK